MNKTDNSFKAKALLALSLIPNTYDILQKIPEETLINIDKVFRLKKEPLASFLNIEKGKASIIEKGLGSMDIEKELDELLKANINFVTIFDENYPYLLKNIDSAPKIFFYKGLLPEDDETCVAIVGSRKCSLYGRMIAKEIAGDLARLGIIVVSGMALGIDTCAHHGAIEGEGFTVAVLGCGVNMPYPQRNRDLYQKIVESGCVISEYAPGTPPLPHNFPARNRIISGMSRAVVVVEAQGKSGALITADFALAQGRDVGAVPGNIKSFYSKGCHRLIKNGAFLVEDSKDILEQLGVEVLASKTQADSLSVGSNEKILLESIPFTPIHIDEIARSSNLNSKDALIALSMLELKGLIVQDFGKMYQRVR